MMQDKEQMLKDIATALRQFDAPDIKFNHAPPAEYIRSSGQTLAEIEGILKHLPLKTAIELAHYFHSLVSHRIYLEALRNIGR